MADVSACGGGRWAETTWTKEDQNLFGFSTETTHWRQRRRAPVLQPSPLSASQRSEEKRLRSKLRCSPHRSVQVVGTAGLATEKGGLDSSWPATKNESQSSFYNMSNTSHVSLHFSTNYWCLSAFSELHSARTSFVWLSVNSSLHVCSPVAAKNQTSRRCEKTRDEFPVECPSVRYLAAVSASHAHPRHGPCAGPSPPVHSVPVRIWIVCRLRGRTVRVGDCVRTGGSDRRPSGLPVCFVQLGGHQGRDPSVRVSPPEHLCHLRPDRAHRWPGSAEPDPRACNINWRWV